MHARCWLGIGLVLVLALSLAAGLAGTPPATVQAQTDAPPLTLYVPSTYQEDTPVPLLVVLHEFAGSGQGIAARTGFNALAEQENFIVAYPDSAQLAWDDWRSEVPGLAGADAAADLDAILQTVADLQTRYSIAPDQIYLAGFAQGGNMAFRLACQAPETFARVLTVATSLWDYQITRCQRYAGEAAPVNILSVLGTADPDFPPSGRVVESTPPQRIVTAQETVEFWAARNGCDLDAPRQDGGAVFYEDCAGDTTTGLYLLEGVGHNWPRTGDFQLNRFGLDMTRLAWQYFSGQTIDFDAPINAEVNTAFTHEPTPRSYTLYVPPGYTGQEPMPVVVALHGRPGNGGGMAYLLDMNAVAAEEGFVVVYPDGFMQGWNYSGDFEGFENNGMDDTTFLQTLLADLALTLNIDPSRQYVTGFSNGGFMTQRLACEAPDTFAAFASIGATFFPGFTRLCEGQPAVPILFMHGTADPSIPWDGITQNNVAITASVEATISFWVGHNGCQQAQTRVESLPVRDDETSVTYFRFGGCTDATQVAFYRINGGGHTIPGVPERLSRQRFGPTTQDIYAPAVIWEFFSQHQLDEAAGE